jgi:hypothetical protein
MSMVNVIRPRPQEWVAMREASIIQIKHIENEKSERVYYRNDCHNNYNKKHQKVKKRQDVWEVRNGDNILKGVTFQETHTYYNKQRNPVE